MQKDFLPFFVKNPTLTQKVTMVSVELSSIPANSNPFHYDPVSVGVDIRKGIMCMTTDTGKDHWPRMYLCNPVTGQQFAQVPVPVDPLFEQVIQLPTNTGVDGLIAFTSPTYGDKPSFKYVSLDEIELRRVVRTPVGTFQSPVYIMIDDTAILYEIVDLLDEIELKGLIAEKFFTEAGNIPDGFINKLYSFLS